MANREATVSVCARETGMLESLSRHRHDDAWRLLGQFGRPRLDGRGQQLADLVGGLLLTGRVAEVDGGRGHPLDGEVAGLGDVPARLAQLVGRVLGGARRLGGVVDPDVGLRGRRGAADGVGDGVEELLTATGDSSALESSPPPMAWKPTSRKTTPRNSSTITMARRGSPEESEWRSFIGPTVSAWG